MSENKTLKDQEAIKKIQDMAGGGEQLMFCTNLGEVPFDVSPMSVQKVEDDGTIWFFSGKDSDRNQYVMQDPRTQLLIADSGSADYLSIYGNAIILIDPEKKKEMWSKMVEVWFPEGPEDPNVTLIKFTPKEGYFWDTKHGKMVSFLKMVGALITGNKMDGGEQGKIKINAD